MNDYQRVETIVLLLTSLVDHPDYSWDEGEQESLHIDVRCGEYETPLQDVIAMGVGSKQGFSVGQLEKLDTVIGLLDLEDSPWVIKLREHGREKKIGLSGDHE